MPSEPIETEPLANPDDEISLVDIIRFFIRRGRLIALMTVGLSGVAIAYSLSQNSSPQYQQELTLSISPLVLSRTFPLPIQVFDQTQVHTIAAEFLNSQEVESVNISASHIKETEDISLTLQSSQPEFFKTATPKVLEQLEEQLAKVLTETVADALTQVEFNLNREQIIFSEIEAQIAQMPQPQDPEDPTLTNLESQRARQISTIAGLKFDREYLENALANLEEFTREIYPIEIERESEIQQQASRSLLQVAILSLIGSFMVAVLAAIICEQIPHIQAELARTSQKGDRDKPKE